MSNLLTDITEISTALGTLVPSLDHGMRTKPVELRYVADGVWSCLVTAYADHVFRESFEAAFANGVALLTSRDGLRGRRPMIVEWKGPHRPPGDDVVPADLRIDHVYLVSCKYLSRVLLNAGPSRLFERLLFGVMQSIGLGMLHRLNTRRCTTRCSQRPRLLTYLLTRETHAGSAAQHPVEPLRPRASRSVAPRVA